MATKVTKARTLLVGVGGIGSMAALNLETGGKAAVTAVLRSNFDAVNKSGFNYKSIDHGIVTGFRPTELRHQVPDVVTEKLEPFKYIVCATKNIPDVSPTLVDIITPAVTPGHSVIVLIQNGLNIEKPMLKAFPNNVVLSGISFCGAFEVGYGNIHHNYKDELYIGAFLNPNLDPKLEEFEAQQFVATYSAGGKCVVEHKPDVSFARWRKLLYNACFNPICAVTDLDTGRMRIANDAVETMVRPAMQEIRAAAKACGVDLPEELEDFMINMDPITMYYAPSMHVDIRQNRFCEYENLVGEPLREGLARGVPMPTLTVFYNILKAKQWLLKERKGLIKIPAEEDHTVQI